MMPSWAAFGSAGDDDKARDVDENDTDEEDEDDDGKDSTPPLDKDAASPTPRPSFSFTAKTEECASLCNGDAGVFSEDPLNQAQLVSKYDDKRIASNET